MNSALAKAAAPPRLGLAATTKNALRRLFYPGLDLHTRNRASLCRFWRVGARDVLDAGSGNGYFSWLAYRSGAAVVAINFDKGQTDKARDFLVGGLRCDPRRLSFEQRNLYELDKEERHFDEIICYETIEHIRDDRRIAREFYRLLRPGGRLHLCAPNRDHPRHQAEILDLNEVGGHVRAGYTLQSYRDLLEPIGFRIEATAGIGPWNLYLADEVLRWFRTRIGDWFAVPLLIGALPLVWTARFDPATPYSLYVCAEKPAAPDDR